MLKNPNPLLVLKRALDCALDFPNVVKSRNPLQFIHLDPLLKQSLHLCPHLLFASDFSRENGLLLQAHFFLLLGDLSRFGFEIMEDFRFAL